MAKIKSIKIFLFAKFVCVIICSALFFALMTEVWVKFNSELTSTGNIISNITTSLIKWKPLNTILSMGPCDHIHNHPKST